MVGSKSTVRDGALEQSVRLRPRIRISVAKQDVMESLSACFIGVCGEEQERGRCHAVMHFDIF